MLAKCSRDCKCYARDKEGNCHILSDTYFRGACPFAKSVEEMREELRFCAKTIKCSDSKYQLMMKDVYDDFIYRNIFKVGDDLK